MAEKFPEIKFHKLEWAVFHYYSRLAGSLFTKIGQTFLQKQSEIYGTDHYYNIDPFNEMSPPTYERDYIYNMAETIYNSFSPEIGWYMGGDDMVCQSSGRWAVGHQQHPQFL